MSTERTTFVQKKLEVLFPKNTFHITELQQCMTNWVYLCESKDMKIVFRHFKSSRIYPFQTIQELYKKGISPKPFYADDMCYIEEYIPYNILSNAQKKNYHESIAKKLAQIHTMDISFKHESCIWDRIRHLYRNVVEKEGEAYIKELLGTINIDLLETFYNTFSQIVRLCHNDMHHANILIKNTEEIYVIDYDYMATNPIAYDIANCWIEYMYDYTSTTPEIPILSQFPTKEQAISFLQEYLCHAKIDIPITELLKEVYYYIPISSLFWCLWGIYQENTDLFDYKKYALLKAAIFRSFEKRLFRSLDAWKPLELHDEWMISLPQVSLVQK